MPAVDLLNSGKRWTDLITRVALPIVLARAMDGLPITYGDLNRAVHTRGKGLAMALTYRYVAGKIGDVCKALAVDLDEDVPLLNAIIVNHMSGLPSDGVDHYLATYFGMTTRQIKRLTKDERDSYAKAAMERVFNFTDWRRIASHLEIAKSQYRKVNIRAAPIPPPDPGKFARGPESEAHKKLKHWLARHPESVSSFGKFGPGNTERVLASGDRLDVLFTNATTCLAAEVKTDKAPEDELQRGVYQCVKYRATLRAMQLASAGAPNAQAVLVINCRPTSMVRRLADLLSVTIIDVSVSFNGRQ